MATFDADTAMVCAGVLLSALAFAEVYSTWKRTRGTERDERDSETTDGSATPDRDSPASDA
ncbi:hypothetical protein C464_10074 [Halorubrum coriense DSM 10284]|uniref:Uncharacterized protein n=1 Tax=Halorubrum coriense DSM 10284 TaxID=1227466 RepID=M0EKS9_9EURY|nr:hypothetical protein [Halorubrum coriense]ELZ46994.1 hypothetical protein C464_10074 [Halorubrum coriense DSM 10284]